MTHIRLGVDLGGTKIRATAISTENGLAVLADQRIETLQADGYAAILDRIRSVVLEVEKAAGVTVPLIGIGTPGVIDRSTNLLKNSNTLCLNSQPIHADLERILQKQVVIENDANCFALAEDRLGAARGSELTFGVIMGTGVGGGLIINGRPRFGLQGIGGEWGHNVIEPDGEPCYCGKRGCVERVLSGPALENFYFTLAGERCAMPEITRRAAAGEKAALTTMERLVHYFGIAISTLVNILDPDCIVLGGGVSNLSILYTDGIEAAKKSVFNSSPVVKVVKNQLGDSAGVFGAAMLENWTNRQNGR